MTDPVSRVPGQRGPAGADGGSGGRPDGDHDRLIPLAEVLAWHQPGVHRVRLSGREVWVRMDGRGIASVSSIGPDRLAALPRD